MQRPAAILRLGLSLAVLAGALCAPALSLSAQPAHLVRDVAQVPPPQPDFLFPLIELVEMGGEMYFAADDGIHGRELWASDGTAEGTRLVIDLCPGLCTGYLISLASAGDTLYFTGNDGVHGVELWRTDGSAGGSALVADVWPGIDGSFPEWLTPDGDRVFFTAHDGVHGSELWVSDGTAGGTSLVADLNAGAGNASPTRLTPLSSGLFFYADDGVHGNEPWITDGTTAGTMLLADVQPGSGSSAGGASFLRSPPFLDWGRLGDRVVFAADDGTHDNEPWVTDGTPAGTSLLADLWDEPYRGSHATGFLVFEGRLYFGAHSGEPGQELWSTDGVSDTYLAATLPTGGDGRGLVPLASAGGLIFLAGATDASGAELWASDGTQAGTYMVADIVAGPESSMGWSVYSGAAALGAKIVFYAETEATGQEPWISDGTEAGTYALGDLNPGANGSTSFLLFAFPSTLDDQVFFFAEDHARGYEPWVTDGTEAGTHILRDLDQQASSAFRCFVPHCLPPVDVQGRAFMSLNDRMTGFEPWVSRGTPGSTHLVADLNTSQYDGVAQGSYPMSTAALGPNALFSARGDDSSAPNRLFVSDGTAAGTGALGEVENPYDLTVLGSFALLSGSTDDAGSELWRTDGTDGGTYRVVDLEPGPDGSGPSFLTRVGSRLFFSARLDATGRGLYSTDGTAGGTSLVADLEDAGGDPYPTILTASGDRLFFAAEVAPWGRELWVSDGTELGTHQVLDLRPGPEGSIRPLTEPIVVGKPEIAAGPGGVFFLADDGAVGSEIWWSDGSEAGTRLLGDVRPGAASSDPRELTPFGDGAVFVADDGVHGRELWIVDGPSADARLLVDLAPGAGSSAPHWLTAVDGALYFNAYRPDVGVELWRSDGTAAGTELVQDVYPGPEPSTPEALAISGRRLYFFANDGVHGFEPWSLLLPGRVPRLSLAAAPTGPGGEVLLTAVLYNPPPETLPDGRDDEILLPLPPEIVGVTVDADAGTAEVRTAAAAATAGSRGAGRAGAALGTGSTIAWNGSLAPGTSVTLTVRGRLTPAALSRTFQLTATAAYDTDADEVADETVLSDDPLLPGDQDPTVLAPASVLAIPTAGPMGLLALALTLLLCGLAALRRSSVEPVRKPTPPG